MKSGSCFKRPSRIDKSEWPLSVQAKFGVILLTGDIEVPTLGPASPWSCPQAAHVLEGDSDSETGRYRDVGAGEGVTGGRVPRSARQHGEGWCVIQTCQFLVTNGTTRGVTASSKASMACDDWELDAVC